VCGEAQHGETRASTAHADKTPCAKRPTPVNPPPPHADGGRRRTALPLTRCAAPS